MDFQINFNINNNYLYFLMAFFKSKWFSITFLFCIVMGVLFFRRPDAFTNPQMWAEDFPIFFQQFEQHGMRSLIMPYGGYLHFVPRLVAIIWGVLNVSYAWLPLCYNLSGAFITFLVALSLWMGADSMGLKNRIPYAVSFLFLPLWPDIFMTITNVNFITGLFLVNFLLIRNTNSSYGNYYITLLLLLIVSLTGPISAILCPLIVAMFWIERKTITVRKAIPMLLIAAGGIAQAVCIKFIDPDFYRGFPGVTEKYHVLRLVTNNLSQLLFLDKVLDSSSIVSILICTLVFVVLLVLLALSYRRISNRNKYVLPVTAALLLAAFIKTYWPNESLILAFQNARYYFVPYTCITSVLILGWDDKIRQWHLAACILVFYLHRDHVRFTLPDKHWSAQLKEVEAGKRELIEINPDGWHFPLYKKDKSKK